MMREKYESLSASVLRDLAKHRGLKGISTLRKEQLIEKMVEAGKGVYDNLIADYKRTQAEFRELEELDKDE